MNAMQAATAVTEYTGVFPGRPDQVQRARKDVARHLAGHPATDDTSELASNAILHSSSNGQSFTVRAEIYPGYVWVEVEDLGGPWILTPRDTSRPHGLDVVEALAGPDNWGVDGDQTGRVVWCRLELAAQR
jgi:hypothetical protein